MVSKKKMSLDGIEVLVKQGESDNLEFKKSTAELGSAGRTLCGVSASVSLTTRQVSG